MTLTIGVGAHPTLQAQVTNPHLSPLTQMTTTSGSSVLRRQHTQVIPAGATVAFRPTPSWLPPRWAEASRDDDDDDGGGGGGGGHRMTEDGSQLQCSGHAPN